MRGRAARSGMRPDGRAGWPTRAPRRAPRPPPRTAPSSPRARGASASRRAPTRSAGAPAAGAPAPPLASRGPPSPPSLRPSPAPLGSSRWHESPREARSSVDAHSPSREDDPYEWGFAGGFCHARAQSSGCARSSEGSREGGPVGPSASDRAPPKGTTTRPALRQHDPRAIFHTHCRIGADASAPPGRRSHGASGIGDRAHAAEGRGECDGEEAGTARGGTRAARGGACGRVWQFRRPTAPERGLRDRRLTSAIPI